VIRYVSFKVVFAMEMVLKMAGLGTYQYLSVSANAVDALIVITSCGELAVAPPEFLGGGDSGTGSGGVLTAFRCMRLFRVFKMAKRWEAMNDLMAKFARTLADVGNVAFLMFLLM